VAQKKRGRGRPAADGGSTREALLAAGAEVFAEKGFEGATTDLIARRARANKAMINYHFRSKKGLYEAILIDTFTGLATRVAAAKGTRSAPDELRAFIAAFAEAAAGHPTFPAMLFREVASGGQHLPKQVFEQLVSILGLVRGIIEQGMRDGTFRPIDPMLTHASLIGALTFFMATDKMRQRARAEFAMPIPLPTLIEYVAFFQELMTRGLAAEPAAENRRER
jgi:AcrR family transcriptional regulator